MRLALVLQLTTSQMQQPQVYKSSKNQVYKTRGIAWMHAPKTGSAFCMTMQHVFDRRRYEALLAAKARGDVSIVSVTSRGCISLKHPFPVPHQWHEPWTAFIPKWVGFIREPKSRLLSAFFDFGHHEGLPRGDFNLAMEAAKRGNITARFAQYVHVFDMRGCQVHVTASVWIRTYMTRSHVSGENAERSGV